MAARRMDGDNGVGDKFISKREVMNICNRLRNAQDKVLIYAVYSGITGKKLQDLRNLKYSDYCNEKRVIEIDNKVVNVDLFFEELLEECKNEKSYYIHNGKVASGAKNKFDINIKSRYVLRGKPTSINNNGLDPIGYPSLQSRLSTISEIVGKSLTYNKLNRSKVVEEMCLLKKDWRHKEVEEYLKSNGLKFKASNILSLIKEVVEKKILENEEGLLTCRCVKKIGGSKLTVYQEESIQGLYRVVAGMSMVNEIQKRKIENEYYKLNEFDTKQENARRNLMQELIEIDKLYWEFVINEGFNIQEQEYLIKIYADKEQYEKQNERYYVSYINGVYDVFANTEYVGPGQRDDVQCSLYSNSEFLNIISWIIDDFNRVNYERRALVLEKMPYNKKEKQVFTPLYLNDIGLDMILALNSGIEFGLAKRAFSISERLENLESVNKATPCIDVSTEGETYIAVIMNNGEYSHLRINNSSNIELFKSLGRRGRYETFGSVEEVLNHFSVTDEEYKEIEFRKSKVEVATCAMGEMEMDSLKRNIDTFNDKVENIGEDEFQKNKNKNYLSYIESCENEIIFSMYDYDLSIKYDVLEQAYIVKRYVDIVGTIERIYDLYKTRDVEELVKWLSTVKLSNYEDIDYSMFLIG